MQDLLKIILYSTLSGSTIIFGGLLAHFFEKYFHKGFVKTEITRSSIAFGGGILVAAVAFVLVPEGIKVLPLVLISGLFMAGAFSFFFINKYLGKRGDATSQIMAMLLDYIPEAIALGAVFAGNANLGLLLALFISFQNFPESFNAFLEMKEGGATTKFCLSIFSLLSVMGIGASIIGYYLLTDKPIPTASLMLFASGGIIYLIFQDIAPMSKLKKNGIPAIGASLGFLVGMIGVKLIG